MTHKITINGQVEVKGRGSLTKIISHYDAIPVLVNFLIEIGARDILAEWDKQRAREKDIVLILTGERQ